MKNNYEVTIVWSLVALFPSLTLKLRFDLPAERSKASKYVAFAVFHQQHSGAPAFTISNQTGKAFTMYSGGKQQPPGGSMP